MTQTKRPPEYPERFKASRAMFLLYPDEYDADGKPLPRKLNRGEKGRFLAAPTVQPENAS